MTEKWGQIQEKWELVRVSGEFELSEFKLPGFYCFIKLFLEGYVGFFFNSFSVISPISVIDRL